MRIGDTEITMDNKREKPPIQWVPWVRRPDREAYHSPPSSAVVKQWILRHIVVLI